jgi:NhaP-type Na+/H+ or K+/H+ antiporter
MLVLPILVSGAGFPKADELPEDIRALASINALPLRHESFDSDADRIVARALALPLRATSSGRKRSLWTTVLYGVIGIMLAIVLYVVVGLVHFWIMDRPLAASIGEPVTEMLFVALLAAGFCFGLLCAPRKQVKR